VDVSGRLSGRFHFGNHLFGSWVIHWAGSEEEISAAALIRTPITLNQERNIVTVLTELSRLHTAMSRPNINICLSRWPSGLRCSSEAVRLLGSRVRISLKAWMFVPCVSCVCVVSGLYNELTARSEKSYHAWWSSVWSGNLKNKAAQTRFELFLYVKYTHYTRLQSVWWWEISNKKVGESDTV
jgi:hypothetical protein